MYIKDLNLIRTFWAVSKTGNFSQAAILLESTQPTVTRQIQTLEQLSGLHLFDRSNRGLKITNAGKNLVATAAKLMASFEQINLEIAGQEDVLRGEVRISANELIGICLLPPALKALRQKHPELQIEIDINNHNASLSQRETDIAFRMQAPTQANLVGRKLPSLPIAIYASQDLIDQIQIPIVLENLPRLPLIGFDRETGMIKVLEKFGIRTKTSDFDIRCDSLLAQIALIRAGTGIGVIQCKLAENYPELIHIMNEFNLPPLDFWLLCHQDIQYSKTIRSVMSFLGDWFAGDPYSHALV